MEDNPVFLWHAHVLTVRIRDTSDWICKALMVFPAGFEPTAYRLGGDRSIRLSYGNRKKTNALNIVYQGIYGGRGRARTDDPLRVRQVLSLLSYSPITGTSLPQRSIFCIAKLTCGFSTINMYIEMPAPSYQSRHFLY